MIRIGFLGLIAGLALLGAEAEVQRYDYREGALSIPISATQINRFTFPSKITSKVVSNEKQLEVSVHENQAFVKLSPLRVTVKIPASGKEAEKIESQEIKYESQEPIEIFFLTEDQQTYSLILIPSTLDTQTIHIKNSKAKREKLAFKEKQTPLVETLSSMVKHYFSSRELRGYEEHPVSKAIFDSPTLQIEQKRLYKGAKFDVHVWQIFNKTTRGIVLEERALIGLIHAPIYAISLYYDNDVYEIPPLSSAEAMVVVAGENR